MSPSEMRVGLTFDLRDAYLEAGFSEVETAEFDRADTIESIENALRELGYQVDRIGNVKQLAARLVAGHRWDLVFNICEGMYGIGREAQVPALLDAYRIPYVFSDTLVCALTLHKGMTKDVVRAAGVATPDYAVVSEPSGVKSVNLAYPLFAKPIAEGTGKGISANSKITTPAELQRVCRQLLKEHRQPVLVERFLPGREFTVGILGTGRKASAFAGKDHHTYGRGRRRLLQCAQDLVTHRPTNRIQALWPVQPDQSYRSLNVEENCRKHERVIIAHPWRCFVRGAKMQGSSQGWEPYRGA